jgi:predicted site-specific integrase-resolvase
VAESANRRRGSQTVGGDEMLTPQELADELRVSVRTLRGWRDRGRGPRVTRVEGAIRYRRSDVDRWLAEQNPPKQGQSP